MSNTAGPGNIVVIAKLTVQDGKRDDAVAALAPMMEHVETEPGTLAYNLVTDDGDDNVIWFYEEYTDATAFAEHGSSEMMKSLGGAIGGFLAGAPEIRQCTFVRGKGR